MTIFISWSGERSKVVGAALKTFLSGVNTEWEPWVSHKDIKVGSDWRTEISKSLNQARAAVVCISPATLKSPWVQFECGALSVSTNCVCPYLIDIKGGQLSGPLGALQAAEATKPGTLALVHALNGRAGEAISTKQIESRLEKLWPAMEQSLVAAPAEDAPPQIEPRYNILDEGGLLDLLEIHFRASADRLSHVIESRLNDFDNDPSKVNFQLLVDNVERVVMEGRSYLTRFRYESVGPVSEFLDKCLPNDALRSRLEDGLRVVAACNPQARRAAAYDLIQKEQASLKKKVRSQLAAVRH